MRFIPTTANRKRANWPLRFLALMLLLVMVLFTPLRAWLHWLDRTVFREQLMDALGHLRSDEDWLSAVPLSTRQDYSWLTAAPVPLRIAHALGESASPTANTVMAMKRSHTAGFRLFEVDLVLDQGELRCQHDLRNASSTPASSGCTFSSLLKALPTDGWLVLDLKSDFTATGDRVTQILSAEPEVARRVIFQLYRPEDFVAFNEWQKNLRLAGPILTTYRSRRKVALVADQVSRLGVRALALPMERFPALNDRPNDVVLLVHPVHDCDALRAARRWDVGGIYATSSLICADVAEARP